ncbi:MAG: flagellar biosynthetic protein FliR [Clostridiales bacterium]|nr:flagellar biosynthetic protein FliR [Clostridiales bacterium]
MEQIVQKISLDLDSFILMFLRTSALIVSSPLFGRKNLPNVLKITFCILLTYIVFTSYSSIATIEYNNILEYALLCIKELLYGVVLGYVTTVFFSLTQTAGHVIDMMMGFGMVNVFDVQSRIKVPMTGNFLYIILIITFFVSNAHLQLIFILNATFSQVPVGAVMLSPRLGYAALEVFVLAFAIALNVAVPLIASGLLGEVVMGIIVRMVPQINIFVLGLPLKVILGFLMLFLVLPVYVSFTEVIFSEMFNSIDAMFKTLGSA